MFTGIVEEIGIIDYVQESQGYRQFKILAKKVTRNVKIGGSIAVNGACLTVTALGPDYFRVDLMKTSSHRTTLGLLGRHAKVHLERALLASDRLDGHLVQGHIDERAKVTKIDQGKGFQNLTISPSQAFMAFIVPRGSVAIDGVSLTVSEVGKDYFRVALIPTTLKDTLLGSLKVGDSVNLEGDMIGKYQVGRALTRREGEGITMDTLEKYGFL